jgi:endonuclease III
MDNKKEIANILIKKGLELLERPIEKGLYTDNNEANNLINDIENYPHAFVLGAVMDSQIDAARAWLIPYKVMVELKDFSFASLQKVNLNKIKNIFIKHNLHRFNEKMAQNFYLAVDRIHNNYNDNASNIWRDNPLSATVVKRFLEFSGVGIKISTMAANILVRNFKIPMKDRICIDISPDIQVTRVFRRIGFIPKDASRELLIYTARELYPKYPGIFDILCWDIGKNWCRPKNLKCGECYLKDYCPKIV